MWRLLATAFLAAVLSGCNYITIDEAQPANNPPDEESVEEQTEQIEVYTPEEIAEQLEEVEEKVN